jgi:hypothetical protein
MMRVMLYEAAQSRLRSKKRSQLTSSFRIDRPNLCNRLGAFFPRSQATVPHPPRPVLTFP